MAEYRHSTHAVFDLKYHMIWCTKYRKKILRGRIAEGARDLIRQVWAAREVVIVRGAVSPDHIHLLLVAPPILSPAKLAQYIKGRSSRHLHAGIRRVAEAILGTAHVGAGVFRRDGGCGGRGKDKGLHREPALGRRRRIVKVTAPTKP
jgi:REP element-mobilizing transposase RayT